MIPRRPSLPSTISRTLGPVEVCGTGRVASVPTGVTTRTARVRSATSPYLSDCMPDERVAIQPPSVECVKLSGKWPAVQPRALSWRSRSGPNTPACTRASREPSSISRTRSIRDMSTETIVRVSCGGASRLPEMFVPPPNGITTASAAIAARSTASTAASSPGRTTTSGTRPTSPLRWRTRSRRLLPRACTTRSSASVETKSTPTASSSAPRSASPSAGSAIVSSSKATERVVGRATSSPSTRWMNPRSSGLSSWVNATPSRPQPHHFMPPTARGAGDGRACTTDVRADCTEPEGYVRRPLPRGRRRRTGSRAGAGPARRRPRLRARCARSPGRRPPPTRARDRPRGRRPRGRCAPRR
jgi:hypothetical protein